MSSMEAELAVVTGPVQPVPVNTTIADVALVKTAADLCGWSLVETTGAAKASVELYDGADTTGELLGEVALASGASDTQWFGFAGVRCTRGVYVHVTAGSVKGALYLRVSRG